MNLIDFPKWIDELFLRFSIIYGGLWNFDLKEEASILAKKLEWYGAITGLPDKAIHLAINKARTHFAEPPSIKDFFDLAQAETKNLKGFGLPEIEDKRRPPPHPLLAEYMAKHPTKPDDPFKLIFEKYTGHERGIKVMEEIKRQFGKKKGG